MCLERGVAWDVEQDTVGDGTSLYTSEGEEVQCLPELGSLRILSFFYPLIILLSSKISFMTNLDNGCINDLTFPSSEEGGEVLLSSAYFAPIQWYQKLNRYSSCLIEQHDNFIKQTYRNRCVIASANGPQALSIPVEKYEGAKCPMKDVRISDHDNWRHQHWNALQSSYGESPFFEYYEDDIRPFFERKWDFLYDFNWEITLKMCELIDIMPCMRRTDSYQTTLPDGTVDFREAIRPKHPGVDTDFVPRRYYQVYQQKFGFLPNLSILDLLFNEGNESVLYL